MRNILTLWCLRILFLFLTAPLQYQGAHILAILPSVWKSHYIFGQHILSQLVEQNNHTVTLISPYNMDECQRENILKDKFREVKINGLLHNWVEMGLSFNLEEMHEKTVMEHFTRLMYATTSNTDHILQNVKVRELMQSSQKFDLLFVDLFLNDALLGFSFYYQIPTVVLSPSGSNTWLNQRFGNPQNAALDPSNFLPYAKDMTFWQRCVNTLMAMFEKLTYSFFHMISQQAVYKKYFDPLCQIANWCKELPHHKLLTENLSLALINTHPTLQYPRAFLPNMMSIAGIHLENNDKRVKLPKHIIEFIAGATEGVIYLSFGANVYELSLEKILQFLDVFETLPGMRFIIKYDGHKTLASTLNVSSKVMLQNWWPQQAILGQKNVKLFITSGGFMSITEAIFYEKSILTIPITPEQYVLSEHLCKQNAAYMINFNDIFYDQLLYGIKQLLGNHKSYYKKSVKQLKTQLLHNFDSTSSLVKTLNAIELTLRTDGLNYLKTHSHHLNFWNSILIDVMFIIIMGLVSILAIPFLVTSCILKRSYQNQTKLDLLNKKELNHRYHCTINDPATSTTRFRDNVNSTYSSKIGKEIDNSFTTKERRRRNSNSDVEVKCRRKLHLNISPSCCNYSVSSSSVPSTPVSKRKTLVFDQLSIDP